jgi:hypothetical protein
MKRALWGLVGLLGLVVAVVAAAQSAEGAAAAAVSGPDANGAYALNLKRPWVKGDVYGLSVDLTLHAEGGSGKDVEFWSPRHKDQHVLFSGKVRVVDVNGNGDGTTLVTKVEKASVAEKEKTRTLKVEGADLGVSFLQGQVNFSLLDGQAIPPEDLAVLKLVFPPPKDVSEADYMSPGAPVRPGQLWSMRTDLLAKALAPLSPKGAAASPAVTEGTVQFQGLESIEGVEYFHLIAKWTFRTGDTDRFTGSNVTQVKEDLFLPRDPASRATRSTTEVNGRVNGRVRNEENQLLEVKGLTKLSRKVIITAG